MKYHILYLNTDESVIGHYPQIEKTLDYDYSSPRSYLNVKWNELADFDPDFRASFTKGALTTNVIELLSIGFGLCVDSEFLDVLKGFKLPEHQMYTVLIKNNEEMLNYHYFHTINSCLPYVNWSATQFEHFRKNKFEVLSEFSVESLEELNDRKRELTFEFGIRIKKVVLNKEFPMFDFVSLWGIFPQFLISERLLEELLDRGITGVNHRPSSLLEISGNH